MKIKKLIEALILSLALLIDVGPVSVHAQENFLVQEDDAYDSSFSGPLTFCVRKDIAAAFAGADGETQPLICDSSGNLHVTSGGGGGGEVTNAGTFAVQEDGAALTAQQAIQTAVELIDNLVHNIDDAVGATDAVIGLGCKHEGDTVHLTTADGDYDIVRCSNFGAMQTEPEQHHVFDALDAVGSWLILDDATANFTTTKKHVLGTDALIFDKVNGSGTFAAVIDQTITAVDLGKPSPHDLLQTVIYIPDLADVAYVLVRVGTDDTNYNEWRIPDSALTAATFETLIFNIGDAAHAGITGNGWNPSVITYIALGVQFDGEDDALVGIIFDEFSFHTNQHTSAELNAEVSSSISSAKVDLQKINGSIVDKGSGNVSNGTQRVVLPDNVALPAGTNAIGKLAANSGVDIGDVSLTAGLLHADSPTTEVAVLLMIDGSADSDIVTTNLSKSSAITITGSGRITKLCLIVEGTAPFSEDGTIYFFDTDPAISSNTDDMTVAEAITVTSMISLKGTDYNDNFATIKINCQATDESFHAITHVVYEQEGATTIANQDFQLHVWYRRNS
ncbi:MAG TPA: hypothetical protein ENI05_01950 [Porticoccus sp.]|nr:hypothetical protein [Porticoccus sp.]